MSIFNNDKNSKFSSTFRRGTAATIDLWVVLILRIITMQLLGALWLNSVLFQFLSDFKNQFGTEEIKAVPEHIAFITAHQIFWSVILFYSIVILVGAIYHAYLNSSSWQATVGKRIMKIMITKENDLKISFKRGLLHYFLAIMPFIYLSYIMIYQLSHKVSLSQAIMNSPLNLIFGVIFVLWVQIQTFSSRKTTIYDLICNTVSINGKTANKWPWSK